MRARLAARALAGRAVGLAVADHDSACDARRGERPRATSGTRTGVVGVVEPPASASAGVVALDAEPIGREGSALCGQVLGLELFLLAELARFGGVDGVRRHRHSPFGLGSATMDGMG